MGMGRIEMSMCISRWTLLTTLALAIVAPRHAVAQVQSEAPDGVYPGRYVANCKPAGNGGCVCDTDSQRRASTSADVASTVDGQVTDIRDPEYLRMIEWFRQTCTSLMQERRR
jgi:hypothetical protein